MVASDSKNRNFGKVHGRMKHSKGNPSLMQYYILPQKKKKTARKKKVGFSFYKSNTGLLPVTRPITVLGAYLGITSSS